MKMKLIIFPILIALVVSYAWTDEHEEIASILKESDRLINEELYDEALSLLEKAITQKYPESQELIMKYMEIKELEKPGTYATVQESEIFDTARALIDHTHHYYDNAISYLKQELDTHPNNEKIIDLIEEFERDKAFWDTAKDEYPQHYKAMMNGTLKIGMPEKMVTFVLGEPDEINRSVGTFGTHEQWIYRREHKTIYVYIENGIFAAYQD